MLEEGILSGPCTIKLTIRHATACVLGGGQSRSTKTSAPSQPSSLHSYPRLSARIVRRKGGRLVAELGLFRYLLKSRESKFCSSRLPLFASEASNSRVVPFN